MKKTPRRIGKIGPGIGAVSLALIGSGYGTGAVAAIQVQLDGQPLATASAPIMRNGSTLVPMRDIFEALGATLNWNPATETVTAQRGSTLISLAINNAFANVNGQRVLLNQPAMLYGGRTMVPLRFVSEAMGAEVHWNSALEQVSITTPQGAGATTAGLPVPSPDVAGGAGTAVAGLRTISVPQGAVMPVTLDTALSSATAQVGQRFTATVLSRRLGDSEFPPGSKVEGIITEAQPKQGNNPGVLDFDFENIVLPDGSRLPLRGQMVALDNNNVLSTQGRLIAKNTTQSNGDRLKVVGIGAGVGYVLGRVLNTNRTATTVLGGAAGYLFSRSRDRRAAEAMLAQHSRLGIRLDDPVTFTDSTGYARPRETYLRTNLDTTGIDQTLATDTPRIITPVQDNGNAYPNYDNNGGPATRGPVTGGRGNGDADNGGAYNGNRNNPDRNYQDRNSDNRNQPSDVYPRDNGRTTDRNGYDQTRNSAPLRRINVPAGAVVPVIVDQALSSANARVGQRFTASMASQKLGDSEFPPGSKLEGIITEARPRAGNEPGVLDMDFQNVVLPDGSRYPVQGELIALDKNNVAMNQGRLTARSSSQSRGDRLKIAGIGAGIGFVLGRALHTNSTLTTVLGGAAGYILGNKRENRTREAVVPQGTRLGVRLNQPVSYSDGGNYNQVRSQYLRVADATPNPDEYLARDENAADTGTANGQSYTPAYYDVAEPRNISIPEGVVVPVTLDNTLSSATAQVGQEFTASVTSQQIGDSEFPTGSKIEGVVTEARPRNGDAPGVLDLDFRNVVLPDGTRQPIRAELTTLDAKNVTTTQGRLVATSSSHKSGDRLKIVGIGAGVGFVLGKVLKQNSTLTAILGGLGGYLYDKSKNRDDNRSAEAVVQQGTRIGVRLDAPVTYVDAAGYADRRLAYLRQ